MFMATLTHLRRRLQAHPLSFLLHHELIRRLSATPRLAFDVERQGPLFVLANLRTSFPDAVLERICGRDMLEAFGLVEPSRPNSPLRAHPPARSDSPPSACIVRADVAFCECLQLLTRLPRLNVTGRARRAASGRFDEECNGQQPCDSVRATRSTERGGSRVSVRVGPRRPRRVRRDRAHRRQQACAAAPNEEQAAIPGPAASPCRAGRRERSCCACTGVAARAAPHSARSPVPREGGRVSPEGLHHARGGGGLPHPLAPRRARRDAVSQEATSR